MELTSKQQRFANLYVTERCGVRAAIGAGYAPGPGVAVTASRLLKKANVRAAIAAQEAVVAAEMSMTRQRVVRELLDAIDLAREQANPAGMIAGWREVARMCGLYAAERVTIGIEAVATENDFTRMSDAELMAIVADTSDDSTAPSMANGRSYSRRPYPVRPRSRGA